jgi:hypothetical protein
VVLSANTHDSLAMILNLSIGEEVEQDARQLEGMAVQQNEVMSSPRSQSSDIDIEKIKNGAAVAETAV